MATDYMKRLKIAQLAKQSASVVVSAAKVIVGKPAWKIKTWEDSVGGVVVDYYHMEAPVDFQDQQPTPALAVNQETYGKGSDDQFYNYHRQCSSLAIPDWPYHFAIENHIAEQAQNYLTVSKGMDTPWWPVIDVEIKPVNEGAPWAYQLKTLLDLIEAGTGKKSVIYTSKYYWGFTYDRNGDPPAWTNDYPLWVSWWPDRLFVDANTSPPKRFLPGGWMDWDLWQYAQDGRYRGYLANDYSLINPNSPLVKFLKG